MTLVAFIIAVLVAVAAGVLLWIRRSAPAAAVGPGAGSARDCCPDCGSEVSLGKQKACSSCGRSLEGLVSKRRSLRPRPLPGVADDEEDDPLARTVVGPRRIERLKSECESCGAALDGAPVCPRCGVRQG